MRISVRLTTRMKTDDEDDADENGNLERFCSQ
jgi:hypothetical protein